MFKKIVIVGLGLMGGSLAAGCRRKFPGATVVGVTRNRKALALAKRKKWIHAGTHDVDAGTAGADVIVLCTPVGTYLPVLRQIDRVCPPGALVMDAGSVKASVLSEVNRVTWKRFSFVGCHPMVGSHHRGISAADPFLYDGGMVLLVKDAKTCPQSFQKARAFWGRFSRNIVTLSPRLHDQWIGQISHLPHALAFCLMHAVEKPSLRFAANGFRDTTRVAASASSIWQPIFQANKKELIRSLGRFEKVLKDFRRKVQLRDPKELIRFMDQARLKRESL